MSTEAEIPKARKREKKGNNSDLEYINWAWKHTDENILNITKSKSISKTKTSIRSLMLY